MLTNVHLVKAVVFPVAMYGCESLTIKKVEHQRIDGFKQWCWRRFLRVPWNARRPNQSILKANSPEYSLEGQMLKLKPKDGQIDQGHRVDPPEWIHTRPRPLKKVLAEMQSGPATLENRDIFVVIFKKLNIKPLSVQFSSVAQSCPTLCDPMNCSTPGLPVHHQLLEFTQTHAHWVSDAIQPSHPLSSPSPPALNSSQHQGLF